MPRRKANNTEEMPPSCWGAVCYYFMEPTKSYSQSLEFECLYDSMWKCKKGKIKKASVAKFVLHGIEETIKLEDQIKNNTYMPLPPHLFKITYPKLRPCSSIHIKDRVVQRSLNDNVIYPLMTHGFIWDNMACQKGKGTQKAMDRLNCFLHRYYINNGNDNTGWVLQCDVHGYYRSMKHSIAKECFSRKLDAETVENATKWLDRQCPSPVGYEPGSQMVQILGISLLDPMDHVIKERAELVVDENGERVVKECDHAKYYGRYMDDFYIISNNKKFLEECRQVMSLELKKLDLELHPTKTRIYPLAEGIMFLGFTYKLTKTGKVIRLINPKNVKHERKKLLKMANLVKKGEMTKHRFYECYGSWKSHAQKGNSNEIIERMDKYVKSLMEGVQ